MHTPENLPAVARMKIERIRQAAADAKALADSDADTVRRHHFQVDQVESALRSIQNRDDCAAEIKVYEGELALLRSEIDRIQAQSNARQRNSSVARVLLNTIERWTEHHEKRELIPVQVTPQLNKGETLQSAIARVRTAISELETLMVRAARAPIPSTEQKAAARAYVADLAKKHAPYIGVHGTIHGPQPKQIAANLSFELFQKDQPMAGMESKLNHARVAGFMAWLFPDQIVTRLESEIDTRADDANAVASDEKLKIEAETPSKILELERIEEALVEQALTAGFDVLRRHTADPAAVLGVAIAPKAKKAA